MASAADKARLMRERQSRWMAQRESAREREGAAAEVPGAPSGAHGAEVLDRITERITERVRGDLQAEIREQARRAFASEAAAGDARLEGALAAEVSRQQCPVCLELMAPPERTPTLLVPCGHTFCAECIKTHKAKSRGPVAKCPYCRELIKGSAVNRALVTIVERLLLERPEIGGGELSPGDQLAPAMAATAIGGGAEAGVKDAAADMVAAVEGTELRLRILRGELEAAGAEAAEAVVLAESAEHSAAAMDSLVADARRKVNEAHEELALAERHACAATERATCERSAAAAAAERAELVRGTIQGLEAELEKQKMLLKAAVRQ